MWAKLKVSFISFFSMCAAHCLLTNKNWEVSLQKEMRLTTDDKREHCLSLRDLGWWSKNLGFGTWDLWIYFHFIRFAEIQLTVLLQGVQRMICYMCILKNDYHNKFNLHHLTWLKFLFSQWELSRTTLVRTFEYTTQYCYVDLILAVRLLPWASFLHA